MNQIIHDKLFNGALHRIVTVFSSDYCFQLKSEAQTIEKEFQLFSNEVTTPHLNQRRNSYMTQFKSSSFRKQ